MILSESPLLSDWYNRMHADSLFSLFHSGIFDPLHNWIWNKNQIFLISILLFFSIYGAEVSTQDTLFT